MTKEVMIAIKHTNDTINDLVRRVDNLAHSHYQENAGKITDLQDAETEQDLRMDGLQESHDDNAEQITDLQDFVIELEYESILNEYGLDDDD